MRGNITRRGKSSWRIKFDVGTTGGERETKYVTVRGTKRQAQAEAARILASIATGTHVDASGETVAQFAERWLRDWADDNVSNKTWTRYAQLLRKHLCTRVGSVPTAETARRRPAGRLRRHGAGGPCRSHPAASAPGDAYDVKARRPMGSRRPQCRQHG